MSDEDFYEAQSEASQIKTRIVTKYFRFWTRVMVSQAKRRRGRLAYFDLYSGPGRYRDGTKSTPLLILEDAVANADLRDILITVFNDENSEYTNELDENINSITGIDDLKNAPIIMTGAVGDNFASVVRQIGSAPSFSFIDPFGYKGVTLELLHSMLRGWGCDLLLFFSYNRINAAIENEAFEEHIVRLFGGETRLQDLRQALHGRRPFEREALILEAFSQALRDMGFEYVLPFTFKRPDMRRTSHHLIFITKHPLAYTVMKDIMASESSESNQGVATFTFTKSLDRDETPLLFLLERPLAELGELLLTKFAGQTLTMHEVFERHHVGTRFIERNYKAALSQLEADGKIVADPRAEKRRRIKGEPTFGNNVLVTFPARNEG